MHADLRTTPMLGKPGSIWEEQSLQATLLVMRVGFSPVTGLQTPLDGEIAYSPLHHVIYFRMLCVREQAWDNVANLNVFFSKLN